jgi:thiol-disulfide isomerase/thioredoxin
MALHNGLAGKHPQDLWFAGHRRRRRRLAAPAFARRLAAVRSRILVATLGATLLATGTAPAGETAGPPPKLAVADLPAILAAVQAPGARAVLVNVWATWCEPCREEMPELLRFYRDNRAHGLRLVLVSADDEDQRAEVERVLAAEGFDGPAFIKHGDDMAFIDGLDPRWSGELPSTFVFDGSGKKRRFWPGTITYRELKKTVGGFLTPRRKS